jgi:hypothetical protein
MCPPVRLNPDATEEEQKTALATTGRDVLLKALIVTSTELHQTEIELEVWKRAYFEVLAELSSLRSGSAYHITCASNTGAE